MVKVLYPNSDWNESDFNHVYREASHQLSLMDKSRMELKPGKYRTWFEPLLLLILLICSLGMVLVNLP